jgi:hypothetical protein
VWGLFVGLAVPYCSSVGNSCLFIDERRTMSHLLQAMLSRNLSPGLADPCGCRKSSESESSWELKKKNKVRGQVRLQYAPVRNLSSEIPGSAASPSPLFFSSILIISALPFLYSTFYSPCLDSSFSFAYKYGPNLSSYVVQSTPSKPDY